MASDTISLRLQPPAFVVPIYRVKQTWMGQAFPGDYTGLLKKVEGKKLN